MSHKKRTRRRVTFMTTDRFKKLTHNALHDILTEEQIIATFDSIFCCKNSIYSSFLDIEQALSDKKRLNKQIARFDDCKLDVESEENESLDLLLSSPANIQLISELEKAYNQPQGSFAQIGSHKVNTNINEIPNSTTQQSIEPTHEDIDIALNNIMTLPPLKIQTSDPSNYKTDTNPPREQEKKRRRKKKKGGKRQTTTIEMETRPTNHHKSSKRKSRSRHNNNNLKPHHNSEQKGKKKARRPMSAGTNAKKWDKIEKERKKRKKHRSLQSEKKLPPKRMSTTALLDKKRSRKIIKQREEIKRIKAKRKAQMGSDNLWKIRNEFTKKSADKTFKRSSLIVKADASKWDRNWDIINKQRVEIRKLKEKRKREKEERERRERERERRRRRVPHDS